MAEKIAEKVQKIEQKEDEKPDYQEKITFLVATFAQGFILIWCLLVLSLGYIKLPNKIWNLEIPDQPRVDSTFAAGLLGSILGGLNIGVNASQVGKKKKKENETAATNNINQQLRGYLIINQLHQ